jgi:dolichol-phosphate mannosyltransferase
MCELTVVVPTLNEYDNIQALVADLYVDLAECSWELIFVDDGSTDGTQDVIRSFARSDPRITLIERFNQRGLASACLRGMHEAKGQYIAVMDADLQHDARLLPIMLAHLSSRHADLAIASRRIRGASFGDLPWLRKALSTCGTYLIHLNQFSAITDPLSGFFMLTREAYLVTASCLEGRGFKLLVDILSNRPPHLHVVEIPYIFRQRVYGRSKVGFLTSIECLRHLRLNAHTRGTSR